VRLEVYNLLGEQVKTLVDEKQNAGEHKVAWDGSDDNGRPVASGIYLYSLRTKEFARSCKLALIR